MSMRLRKYTIPVLLLGSVFPSFLLSCGHQSSMKMTNEDVAIAFEDTAYDFGKVGQQESVVSHSFVFKNTGKKPLVISKVETSCGCTTVAFPHQPIPSGEERKIDVQLHSTQLVPGHFDKDIRVYSNTMGGLNELKIHGEIMP